MNRKQGLKLYIIGIGCLLGAVVISAVAAILHMPLGHWSAWLMPSVFFAVLGLACSQHRVHMSDSKTLALGTIVHLAVPIALPLPIAIVTIALGKIASEVLFRLRRVTKSWRAPVVNAGGVVIASAMGGAAFHLLHGDHYLWSSGPRVLFAFPALAALALLYFLIDTSVVLFAVTLNGRDPLTSVFTFNFRSTVTPQFSVILVGIVFAILWHANPILSIFVAVPLVLSVRSFEGVARLRNETIKAVLKVAESIDIRDKGTGEHSDRLAFEAKRLATAIGLTPEHAREIELAARVHDLGKIGISNDILLKNGPLTPEERKIMEEHPVIGADILSSYSAFQSSVDIVRHHHERWDGKGYPDGIKGEAIPIGSRIIAVVDAFDAMTEDRPYRKGMSPKVAVDRLKDAMGAQFDAKICAAYIQLLIEDGIYVPPEQAPTLRLVPKPGKETPDPATPGREPLTAAR